MLNKLLLKLSVPLFLFFLFIGAVSSSRVAYAVVGATCGVASEFYGFCGDGSSGTCDPGEYCDLAADNVARCFARQDCICADIDIGYGVGDAGCINGDVCPIGNTQVRCGPPAADATQCTAAGFLTCPGGVCACGATPGNVASLNCPEHTECMETGFNVFSCVSTVRCGGDWVGACPSMITNCDFDPNASPPRSSCEMCGCGENQRCMQTGPGTINCQNVAGCGNNCSTNGTCTPSAVFNTDTKCCTGLCSPMPLGDGYNHCISCGAEGQIIPKFGPLPGWDPDTKCCSGSCVGSDPTFCTCAAPAAGSCANAVGAPCSVTGEPNPLCCPPLLECNPATRTCRTMVPGPGACSGINVSCNPNDGLPNNGCCPGFQCDHYDGDAVGVFKCGGNLVWSLPADVTYRGPIIDFKQLVKLIYNIILPVGVAIALFIIAKSGYDIMTSEGNPAKVAESKENLTAAIIGAIFTLLSVAILRLIIVSFIGTF